MAYIIGRIFPMIRRAQTPRDGPAIPQVAILCRWRIGACPPRWVPDFLMSKGLERWRPAASSSSTCGSTASASGPASLGPAGRASAPPGIGGDAVLHTLRLPALPAFRGRPRARDSSSGSGRLLPQPSSSDPARLLGDPLGDRRGDGSHARQLRPAARIARRATRSPGAGCLPRAELRPRNDPHRDRAGMVTRHRGGVLSRASTLGPDRVRARPTGLERLATPAARIAPTGRDAPGRGLGEAGCLISRAWIGPGFGWVNDWHSVLERSFWVQADLFAYGMLLAVLSVAVEDGRIQLPRGWWPVTASAFVGARCRDGGRLRQGSDQPVRLRLVDGPRDAACSFPSSCSRGATASVGRSSWAGSRPGRSCGSGSSPTASSSGTNRSSGGFGTGACWPPGRELEDSSLNLVIVGTVSLALSALTYRVVELPALRRKARTPTRDEAVAVVAAAP